MLAHSEGPAQQRPAATAAAAAAPSSGPGGSSGGGGVGGSGEAPAYTNRLVHEQSPYLLQHAHNPVDWYPWGEEAFSRARSEDKPIFLSVGYATCHWCHVMERESFEDPETADLLNRHFVAVKVDREERPDVDRVYMTYVQAVSGSGGWPMSVWLTPQLEPFYGGTYYPPKDMFMGGMLARPGFPTVLRRIASLWRTNREDLQSKAASTLTQLTEALEPEQPYAAAAGATESGSGSAASAGPPLSASLAGAAVDACAEALARRYDGEHGGFGGPPKFPRPCEIALLLRAAGRLEERRDPLGASRLRGMALSSLRAMAGGGMWDVVGGGFHRYSVDELWHVPHFEKMLYDNPQLAAVYTAAFQLTGEEAYAQVVRGTLDYLLRDLLSPQGGLYSAEDADSVDPHSFEAMRAAAATEAAAEAEARGQAAAAAVDTAAPAETAAAGAAPRAASVAGLAGVGAGTAHAGGERREGAFYVWDYGEVNSVLGPELGPLFCLAYGIEEDGNCSRSERSDPHGEFEGRNVPYGAMTAAAAAARLGLPYAADPAEAERRLAAAREALHAVRSRRPRPSLDDKIVTAWNGMAIGALALASRALAAQRQVERLFPSEGRPAPAYLAAARRVAAFVRAELWQPVAGGGAGRLRRSYCRGPSGVPGFADDYAALIGGLLELYECGGGREWLQWAMQLQAVQDELFWDEQSGGYYSTPDPASPDGDPSIRIRIKDDYDGAEPAASSLSALNLLRLAALAPCRSEHGRGAAAGGGAMSYESAALRTLGSFSRRLAQAPLAVPALCCAAHGLAGRPHRQVIIAGTPGAPDTEALLDAVHAPYCPDKVVLLIDPADPDDMAFWSRHNPAAHGMVAAHCERAGGGGSAGSGAGGTAAGSLPATALICQDFTCQAPTRDPARVRQLLAAQQTPPGAASLRPFDMKL